jgi:phage terminase small subunit
MKQPKQKLNKKDADGLTAAERHAVDRYLIHGNHARAYREAGFRLMSRHGLRNKANPMRLFTRPHVALVVERELAERRQRCKMEASWVIQQLSYIVTFDPRKIFDEDGKLLHVADMDEATAACISSVDVEEETEYIDGDEKKKIPDRHIVTRTTKLRFHSKNEAILMAMKHFKLLGEESGTPPPAAAPVLNVTFTIPQAPQLTQGTVDVTENVKGVIIDGEVMP